MGGGGHHIYIYIYIYMYMYIYTIGVHVIVSLHRIFKGMLLHEKKHRISGSRAECPDLHSKPQAVRRERQDFCLPQPESEHQNRRVALGRLDWHQTTSAEREWL